MSGQRSHAGHWVFLVALIMAGCQRPSDITTTNKEVVREFFAALDAQDFTALSDLLVDEFVIHLANGTDRVGRDAAFQVIRGFYRSFPDYTHDIEELIAEGDRVAAKVVLSRPRSWPTSWQKRERKVHYYRNQGIFVRHPPRESRCSLSEMTPDEGFLRKEGRLSDQDDASIFLLDALLD